MTEPTPDASRPADAAGRALLAISRALAVIGGLLACVVAVMVTVSVTGRYLFSAPIPGDYDIVGIISGCAIFCFLPYCQMIRGNVVVDFFTNGLPVAQELMNIPGIEVSLLGGQLRSENASVVGPQAEAMLRSLWFDQLFLGVSAIGEDGAIYSVDSAEASLNLCMLSRAEQKFLLSDSSKFGTMATYRVAPLTAVRVVTDGQLATDWRGRLADLGVDATIAGDGVLP